MFDALAKLMTDALARALREEIAGGHQLQFSARDPVPSVTAPRAGAPPADAADKGRSDADRGPDYLSMIIRLARAEGVNIEEYAHRLVRRAYVARFGTG